MSPEDTYNGDRLPGMILKFWRSRGMLSRQHMVRTMVAAAAIGMKGVFQNRYDNYALSPEFCRRGFASRMEDIRDRERPALPALPPSAVRPARRVRQTGGPDPQRSRRRDTTRPRTERQFTDNSVTQPPPTRPGTEQTYERGQPGT